MGAPYRFKQADLKRAVKGVREGGVSVGRIEIDPNGKIVIFPTGPASENGRDTSWDDV